MFEPSITVVGNVADAPDLRSTPQGVSVGDFRVAVNPRKRDPNGTWYDGETIWFRVDVWRQLAEHTALSIKKGDRVVVSGRLTSDTWMDKGGEARSTLRVLADSVGLELSRSAASSLRSPRLVANADPASFDRHTGEVFSEDLPEDLPEDVLAETAEDVLAETADEEAMPVAV